MSKRIPLTQGKFAIVDDEDYDWLMQWKWCIFKSKGIIKGACRNIRKPRKIIKILMHREIMHAPQDKQIDHKDHNILNNRKENLRLCTNSQNAQNQRPIRGGFSKYKGVCRLKGSSKWVAQIKFLGKSVTLGTFTNELQAAKAYNEKAKEVFGEFACLNALF